MRVQHQNFFWSFFRFDGFDVYFSRNGRNLALYTASFVQNYLQEIEQRVGEPVADKMQFIIFNRLTDYRQSNIGFLDVENYNTGGVTRINGNRVFLFFDGNYVDFERQIREGITEILVRQVLFGTTLASQVRNNTQLTVPDWFLYGMISYLSRPWCVDLDDMMRDAMLSRRFRFIAALEGEDAKLAGHSLFRYIAETYGDGTVLRILRVTASQRRIEAGLRFVLNKNFRQLMRDWQSFYLENTQFYGETEAPDIENSLRRVRQRDREHYQFLISPDGSHVAYISNELGRARVHVRNLETGRRRVVMRIGFAINDRPDYSYPALAWHPNGEILAIAVERRGALALYLHNIKTRESDWINMETLEKILSMDFAPHGRTLVFSGVQNGQSDIFLFNMGTRVLTQITRDIYDDANPRFLRNGTQIIFSSNRPTDTLTRNQRYSRAPLLNPNHDLFIYDLERPSTTLLRVTNDSLVNFSNPIEYERGVFAFLTDESGVRNRAIGVIDSVIASVDTIIHWRHVTDFRTVTNSSRNINEHDVNPIMQELAELIAYNNRNRLIVREAEPSQLLETTNPPATRFRANEIAIRQRRLEQLQIADSLQQIDSLQHVGRRRLRQPTTRDMVDQMVERVLIENFAEPVGAENLPPTQQDIISIFEYDTIVGVENLRPLHDTIPVAGADLQSVPNITEQIGTDVDVRINEKQIDSIREELRERLIQLLGFEDAGTETPRLTLNPQQRNYNVEFFINETTTQVGFSFLNSSYQAFTGGASPIFLNPGATGFLKIAATDLMENHRLIAGFRLGFDLRSNEFLLSYENRERRTARQYLFHRQAISQAGQWGHTLRQVSHNAYFILSHPLSEVLLLRGSVIGRADNFYVRAADYFSLIQDEQFFRSGWSLWGGLRGEVIYDRTRMLGRNLPLGARSKLFFEYYQSLNERGTTMFVVGADYRHYTRIFRTFIWANRVAGSTSFGQRRLIYYMGGVDNGILANWRFIQFNREIPVDQTQNYAFQTLATSMRGFHQNIRNGNTFAVASTELRLPIMQTLFARPIGGQWLQSLQLIGFVDVGSAWVGLNPWNRDNLFFQREINDGTDLTIIVQRELSPFVAGVGWGIRTSLAGYFIRLDRANGFEDGHFHRRIWHLSFGFDF